MKTKFNWYGNKVGKDIRKDYGRATWKAAEFLLGEANKKVPHDEGTLERSGIVTQGGLSGMPSVVYSQAENEQRPKNNFKFNFGSGDSFYISYNTPYAIKQHEDTTLNHKYGREAKWLENTAKRTSNKIEKWIAKEMK